MLQYWVPAIQGLWPGAVRPLAILALTLWVCAGQQPSLESLAHSYRKDPSSATRAPLQRFALAHPKDLPGAEALLALGAADYERAQYLTAISNLREAGARLPALDDYVEFLLGSAQFGQQNYVGTIQELAPLFKAKTPSPVFPRAVLLTARAYMEAKQPDLAASLLRDHQSALPPISMGLLLGKALEAARKLPVAAEAYQSVYCNKPNAPEAAEAEAALSRIKASLGTAYPPPTPAMLLTRANALLSGGNPGRAETEFRELLPRLTGPENDLVRLRIGVSRFQAKDYQGALRYLQALSVAAPDADAERLYYLQAAAFRLDREEDAAAATVQLDKQHPLSNWRLQALVNAGNRYLTQNKPDAYLPMYRACYEAFPKDAQASYCHWKVVWNEYLNRNPAGATAAFKQHLSTYPTSEKTPAALYFLGRLAETSNAFDAAKAYYQEVVRRFPGYYHAVLARERLARKELAQAAVATHAAEFIQSLPSVPKVDPQQFESDALTRFRMDRAKLLSQAGLDDWAEFELRFASKNGARSSLMAIELAQLADSRGAYDQGIRYIKSLAPGYLSLPLDGAPERFWKLAFPLPYRQALEANCRERSLDPYLVAGLIRQESEFNPNALSVSNAHGLTQVMPATGRQLSRKFGVKVFTANALFEPELNLKLGIYYIRSLLDQNAGSWERTLAAYNAGQSRVKTWVTFANFEEPAEFAESIPFTQTRDYVQIVMRNADIYRRLYGGKDGAVPSSHEPSRAFNDASPPVPLPQ